MKHIAVLILFSIIYIGCAGQTGIPGPKGDKGPPGIKGDVGPRGPAGKSISPDMLKRLDTMLAKQNAPDESIVGSVAYSFGIAPMITGFIFLTNMGRLYKLENKNPRTLGDKIEPAGQIADKNNFITFTRTTYGDDISQFFSAVTRTGEVFTSPDLKTWTAKDSIPIKK